MKALIGLLFFLVGISLCYQIDNMTNSLWGIPFAIIGGAIGGHLVARWQIEKD